MNGPQLLIGAFGRVQRSVNQVLDGLSAEDLAFRIDDEANSIAWLIWHLTRIQDNHLAAPIGSEQIWTAQNWMERFALPFDAKATGNHQTTDDVAAVQVESGDLLMDYHDAVHDRTANFLATVEDRDFDRVIDTSYDPPVTLGVRFISVVNDNLQHAGQAAFIRGFLQRH